MSWMFCSCNDCTVDPRRSNPSRRQFLRGAAALTLASTFAPSAFAKEAYLPKPENIMSPEAALERLVKGNERYASGNSAPHDYVSARASLVKAQNPFACILGCSDSRVGPEICFDESLGDLFVTRIAGNYLNLDILASLEYGTAVLGAPIIMVLGHTKCGAVSAAVKAEQENTEFPGHIQIISSALAPAVQRLGTRGLNTEELIEAVTIENIRDNVTMLRRSTPLLNRRVQEGKLRVVGGLYNLDTGKVTLVT